MPVQPGGWPASVSADTKEVIVDGPNRDVADLRARLLADRAALEGSSQDTAGSRAPVELDQTSVGRLSRVDAIQAQAMAQATERRRAETIRRINQALARLDAGTFGACVMCGEDIAPKRLALDPAIPTCLDCASGKARKSAGEARTFGPAAQTLGIVTPIMSPSRTMAASWVSVQPSVSAGRMGRTIQR